MKVCDSIRGLPGSTNLSWAIDRRFVVLVHLVAIKVGCVAIWFGLTLILESGVLTGVVEGEHSLRFMSGKVCAPNRVSIDLKPGDGKSLSVVSGRPFYFSIRQSRPIHYRQRLTTSFTLCRQRRQVIVFPFFIEQIQPLMQDRQNWWQHGNTTQFILSSRTSFSLATSSRIHSLSIKHPQALSLAYCSATSLSSVFNRALDCVIERTIHVYYLVGCEV